MKICLLLPDGLRPDALSQVPRGRELLAGSQYTLEARTVWPSVTLPCHMSLFHSVGPDRHGTTTNVYMPQVRPVRSLLDLLWDSKKEILLAYDWEQLRDIARPGCARTVLFRAAKRQGGQTYRDLARAVTEELQSGQYDFCFFYMNLPDFVGHKLGWMSPEYLQAVDTCCATVLDLQKALPQDWLFVLVSDHGGHDRCHGTQAPEDMTIPLAVFGNREGLDFRLAGADIQDVAPTVAALFGLEPDEDWEGRVLLP